jgi:DNA polymerase-3 subunit gamma/tau
MALIRLAYAADLPPADKLVRDILDNGAAPRAPSLAPTPSRSGSSPSATAPRLQPAPQEEGAPVMKGLEDIALLAARHHAPVLKVHIENDLHLVRLEPGRLEFRPGPRAPRTLAGDLQQKLRDWTGARWSVSVTSEGGAPTLAEQKKSTKAARIESVMQAPMVRAVLDRFPGAEIVAVRDVEPPPASAPKSED